MHEILKKKHVNTGVVVLYLEKAMVIPVYDTNLLGIFMQRSL